MNQNFYMCGQSENAVHIGQNNWILEEHVTIGSYMCYEYVKSPFTDT